MIQIFGWTILYSLWQIVFIAVLYLVIKTLWKQATSLQQYYLALVALVSGFLAPIFTFNYLWRDTTVLKINNTLPPIINEPIELTTTVGTTVEGVINTSLTFVDYLSMCLPYLVVFWGLGVFYFTIRFFINLSRINKLQNIDNEVITGEWLTKISAFKKQLNIQKEVQVFLSKHIKEPITFGHFKPVILLPISLMTGFDSQAIETIIVHELAHIKRHDYLINLIQSVIEIILFYHPCIWWLSKEIRAIREHCCDDLVLSMGDNRAAYVETLTALQWRKIGAPYGQVVPNSLSMTASGNDGDFTRRIKRMFGAEEEGFSFRQLMGVFLLLLIMAVGGVIYQKYFDSIQKEKSSIVILSEKESEIKINEKTTKIELEQWTERVSAQGIEFDFKGSKFDEQNRVIELRGNYDAGGNKGDFFAVDLPCVNATFNLYNDQLGGPFFTYPCKEKQAANKAQKESKPAIEIFWINQELFDAGEDEMIKIINEKKIFDGYSLNPETYSINGTYTISQEKPFFEVDDVTKTPIKITLENGLVKSLEVIEQTGNPLSSLIINKGMTMKELFESAESFGKDSDTRVNFNELDFDDNNQLKGKIRGTIRPNKSGVYHFFEVHDINKYNILFQASSDTILAPKYITKEEGIISKVEHQSSESSKIKIDDQTTRADLANWANVITKHGIIFNYEKSIFDNKDRLIGLNGKFNGQCCFNDAFFISKLDEVEVHLEVKDNYIYQPTIITQTEDGLKELKEKFWSDAVKNAAVNPELNNPYWIEGSLRKMKIISNGEEKSYKPKPLPYQDLESYKEWRDSTRSSLSEKNKTPSSFVPILKEKEDFERYVDSVAQSSVGKRTPTLRKEYEIGLIQAKNIREINFWKQKIAALDAMSESFPKSLQNHAMLIPSDKESIESIEEKKLLYRKKIPNAIFTAGNLVSEDDFQRYVDSIEQSSLGEVESESPFKLDAKTGLFPNIKNIREQTMNIPKIDPNFYPQSPNDIPKTYFSDGHLIVGQNHPLINTSPTITAQNQKNLRKDSLQNFLQWDDQRFELLPKPKRNSLMAPNIQVTKKEWDRLRTAPFTFKISGKWYKIRNVDEIVLVPFKKDPVSVSIGKMGYYHAIFEFNKKADKLLENATVGDYIYYENIDFGGAYTIGIAVQIVEDKPNNDTGFNVKEEVDFKDAEMSFSKEFTDASNNTTNNWGQLEETPLSIIPNQDRPRSILPYLNRPDNSVRLKSNDGTAVFYVDGVNWSRKSPYKLDPEMIESIDIVSGMKATLLYGAQKAVLITTKKVNKAGVQKNK